MPSRVHRSLSELSWTEQANCLGVPVEVFYSEYRELQRLAKSFCRGCPVREQCLSYAMGHEWYGIWGGMNSEERLRIRRKKYRHAV